MTKPYIKKEANDDEDLISLKERCSKLKQRIVNSCTAQEELMETLKAQVPTSVNTLQISLDIISVFKGNATKSKARQRKLSFSEPVSELNDVFLPNGVKIPAEENGFPRIDRDGSNEPRSGSNEPRSPSQSYSLMEIDHNQDNPLNAVKAMVATVLLDYTPFVPLDSAAILRKLEGGNLTPSQKNALIELGGELGASAAVEKALKAIADEKSGIEIEEYTVNSKSRVMVLEVDQPLLAESIQQHTDVSDDAVIDPESMGFNISHSGMNSGVPQNVAGNPEQRFRGRNPFFQSAILPSQPGFLPPVTEKNGMKEVEALLKKKSFKEMQKSKVEEELYDLIHRPTAKKSAVVARFKSKGDAQVKEYCEHLTKEDCRRNHNSIIECEKIHFRRIISALTDISLGDCTFLDNCRRRKFCRYIHYEVDPFPVTEPPMGMDIDKPLNAEYCSELELGEPQWINCDVRTFKMDILGQFGVIMADPPWDIHMELPYGTMTDDEVRDLNVPALQNEGLIFLWVTGRAMELGRECLELWGYRRVEELTWVKVNQLQRIINTGRTGHWLNHSKEHCLVGIKGKPEINCKIDTDVIVSEIREVSRKPDEVYAMLERISPRSRKIELFARKHNIHPGWLALGNQLDGVRIVDDELRARLKAAYPEMEIKS